MTQEEKELLLKDLCTRLQYGIKFKADDEEHIRQIHYIKDENVYIREYPNLPYWIDTIKPYLRSMSSMTEEEKEQLAIIRSEDFQLVRQWIKNESIKETGVPCPVTCGEIDYCNKKHFDYRGLIPMGLALEAPEGMYEIQN